MAAKFWLYSHNFTNSGAPLVLAAVARELAAAGLRKQLRILSWGGLHDQRHSILQHQLVAEGIYCKVLHQCELPPKIKVGDRLMLNTIALPNSVILQALQWLADGTLSRLDWFAHESDPDIWIRSKQTKELIQLALASGALFLRVPSQKVLLTYQNYFCCKEHKQLSVQCPGIHGRAIFDSSNLVKHDYSSSLRLALVGSVGSGNKGHLWLLELLAKVFEQYPNDTPGIRKIELGFIGIETGKYAGLSRHVINKAVSLLGSNFSWTEVLTPDKVLSRLVRFNFLVNCSFKEAFSCASSEALALGLPLLRIRNGGFEEQLIPYKTGFDLGDPSSTITTRQISLIQQLRNPSQISDSLLSQISANARSKGLKFLNIHYRDWLLN